MKSDIEIRKDVMDQLMWEPILNESEIGVFVKHGIVTLYGKVDTYSKKVAAEQAVKKVAGVKAVAEEIQVGIATEFHRTDTEIAEAVLHALSWNILVPDESIEVKVEDGYVSLNGEVDWDYQRQAAIKAIDNLAGIKMVNNFITIRPSITPANIKEKIAAAFERSATIDSGKINVEVDGRKVTLTGKVRSFAEQEDAVYAAWAAPGVDQVEDRLELEESVLVW
ncbi:MULTISPECIES: BON domain-containing protein [Niastella]|uniref:BON domain-containing protein n=1 Tax=Niastella soli TaxID=2821487 RepID=A0ABS3YWU6_9BACT|nr:BON domain-containing protein [Niastella soli]MBO9201972.1 BON domain-containing protein [Niastella soli]